MFKRISGWRAWVLGAGGVLGVLTGLIGYADLAKAVLPERYKAYVPLVMMFGFACALAAVGWEPEKVDAEPSIVINHFSDWDEDGEHGPETFHYLIFRNVGHYPLTRVAMDPIRILGINVRLAKEIEALLPGQPETKVSIYSLGTAMGKARATLYGRPPRPKGPFLARMTIRCLDWKQRESYAMDYCLTFRGDDTVDVRRVHPGEDVEWTNFDALVAPKVGQAPSS